MTRNRTWSGLLDYVVLLSEKQLKSLACLAQRLFHRISPQYVLVGNNIMIILTLYPLTSVCLFSTLFSLHFLQY